MLLTAEANSWMCIPRYTGPTYETLSDKGFCTVEALKFSQSSNINMKCISSVYLSYVCLIVLLQIHQLFCLGWAQEWASSVAFNSYLGPNLTVRWAKLWGFLALHSIMQQRLNVSQTLTAANSTQWNSTFSPWLNNSVIQSHQATVLGQLTWWWVNTLKQNNRQSLPTRYFPCRVQKGGATEIPKYQVDPCYSIECAACDILTPTPTELLQSSGTNEHRFHSWSGPAPKNHIKPLVFIGLSLRTTLLTIQCIKPA